MEICKICSKEFKSKKSLCMHLVLKHKYTIEQTIEYYDKYYKKEGEDVCKFCHKKSKFKNFVQGYFYYCDSDECLSKSRASNTVESYMYKYNMSEEDAIIEYTKRFEENGGLIKKSFDEILKNDPDFNKKRSRQTKEFYISRGYSEENAIKNAHEIQLEINEKTLKKRHEHPENYTDVNPTQLAYWIKKGYSEEEAKIKVSERQSTFSLEKCIAKLGEVEGRKRWLDRQEKWYKNYKKSNFSKVSQELFWSIFEKLDDKMKTKIKFATLHKGIKDESGHNHELRLRLEHLILPDFIDTNTNKIIEFDGSYYHNNSAERIVYDKERDEMLKNNNYLVLHIDENEYYNDKQKTIQQCINFLKS